jgi:hypothetical protein
MSPPGWFGGSIAGRTCLPAYDPRHERCVIPQAFVKFAHFQRHIRADRC